MTDFGFEGLDFDLAETDIEEDEIPEVDEVNEPRAKLGDIFKLGNHILMCGDSTDKKQVEHLMDGAKADMIFTDPPYNVDYEGQNGMKIKNDKQKEDDFYNFLLKAFTNMSESIKDGGTVYCCHSDVEALNFLLAFKNAGFKFTECVVWVKNSFVFGRKDYHCRHELILYGWKEGASHYFINDRTQDTVWEYDKPKHNDLHPTMKPLPLVARAVKNSSKKKNIVLDLFGGSGTTLIVCEQLERKCYMMELDPRYVDVIIKRWENYTGKEAILLKNIK